MLAVGIRLSKVGAGFYYRQTKTLESLPNVQRLQLRKSTPDTFYIGAPFHSSRKCHMPSLPSLWCLVDFRHLCKFSYTGGYVGR